MSGRGNQLGQALGQVYGVVAKTLVEPGHHGQLNGHRQGHGAGHHFDGQAHVQVVHLVVEAVQYRGGHGLSLGIGIGRVPPHVDGHLSHPLDQTPAPGRELAPQPPRRPAGHVFGQVAVAFEIREHPDDGHQEAQVDRRGDAAHRQLFEGQLLDVVVEGVHHLVAVGQQLGRLAVPRQKGIGGS